VSDSGRIDRAPRRRGARRKTTRRVKEITEEKIRERASRCCPRAMRNTCQFATVENSRFPGKGFGGGRKIEGGSLRSEFWNRKKKEN